MYMIIYLESKPEEQTNIYKQLCCFILMLCYNTTYINFKIQVIINISKKFLKSFSFAVKEMQFDQMKFFVVQF